MKKLVALLFVLSIWISPATSHAADKSKAPSSPIYVFTNDDGTLHTYATVFTAGGTQNDPTLSFLQSINTQGLGIGGGFFGTPRLAMLPSSIDTVPLRLRRGYWRYSVYQHPVDEFGRQLPRLVQ